MLDPSCPMLPEWEQTGPGAALSRKCRLLVTCGEEIVVPLDLSAAERNDYVEDCPVCYRPNVIHVEVEDDGELRMWAEAE